MSDRPSLRAPCPDAVSYHCRYGRDPAFTAGGAGQRFGGLHARYLRLLAWPGEPHEELSLRDGRGECYHLLLPSFYRLLDALHRDGRAFAVVFRTFGTDLPRALRALRCALDGQHPQFPALRDLAVSGTGGGVWWDWGESGGTGGFFPPKRGVCGAVGALLGGSLLIQAVLRSFRSPLVVPQQAESEQRWKRGEGAWRWLLASIPRGEEALQAHLLPSLPSAVSTLLLVICDSAVTVCLLWKPLTSRHSSLWTSLPARYAAASERWC